MIPNNNLKYYSIHDVKYKIHGRTDDTQNPIPLFWNGSAVEVNVTGSELWIDIEVDFDMHEPWAGCSINGEMISRQMLMAGRYKLCLFRGMSKGSIKNVRFFRELQAMSEDNANHLLVHGFSSDGSFFPVADRKYKLEFVGDSITSGEGTYGARAEEDWIPMFMSASRNYAVMVSECLDADYRLISQGGWGVLTGWDNDPYHNIPSCYEKICGIVHGEANETLGAMKPYAFSSWKPDAVIVNLGTNDASAFNQPLWQDLNTGESFKQYMNPDGSYEEASLKRLQKAVTDFLALIRKNNPDSYIVWIYGMLGYELTLPITDAINSYRKLTGDNKVSFLQLPATTDETVGSRSHPGLLSHERSAQLLIEYLKVLFLS